MIDQDFFQMPDLRQAPQTFPDRDYEYTVLHLLERHGKAEGAFLDSYQEIAQRSSAGHAVRFLVGLILEDEERHHKVFEQMANGIKSFLWEIPVEPSLPAMRSRPDPDLLAETKRLLKFEKQDAKELRKLRKTLKDSQPSSLDPLMVELMLLDTAKHIAILKHIKSCLR